MMAHTIRRGLVWLQDGALRGRRQNRTLHAERVADRRKQRRQARRADAAALADYYEDMDWLAKFEADLMAREYEDDYTDDRYEDWLGELEDDEARKVSDDDSFDDLYDPNNWPNVMVPGYGWDEWKERYA